MLLKELIVIARSDSQAWVELSAISCGAGDLEAASIILDVAFQLLMYEYTVCEEGIFAAMVRLFTQRILAKACSFSFGGDVMLASFASGARARQKTETVSLRQALESRTQ